MLEPVPASRRHDGAHPAQHEPTTRAIVINAEAIAVDQDALGIQGRVVAAPAAGL